jgi:hypothetical protein
MRRVRCGALADTGILSGAYLNFLGLGHWSSACLSEEVSVTVGSKRVGQREWKMENLARRHRPVRTPKYPSKEKREKKPF